MIYMLALASRVLIYLRFILLSRPSDPLGGKKRGRRAFWCSFVVFRVSFCVLHSTFVNKLARDFQISKARLTTFTFAALNLY